MIRGLSSVAGLAHSETIIQERYGEAAMIHARDTIGALRVRHDGFKHLRTPDEFRRWTRDLYLFQRAGALNVVYKRTGADDNACSAVRALAELEQEIGLVAMIDNPDALEDGWEDRPG